MPILFKDVDGWFNFAPLYDDVVNWSSDGDLFVEVGCWLGKSTCYLAEAIKLSGKDIKLYAVDTWNGSDEEEHKKWIQQNGEDSVFLRFIRHMLWAEIMEYIVPLRLESVNAAQIFNDSSLQFVFLDADHHYPSIRADIDAWLPKIQKGGYIGGHDYNPENPHAAGIVQAVKETFGDDYAQRDNSWLNQRPPKRTI